MKAFQASVSLSISKFIASYGRISSPSQEKKDQKFLVNVGPAHPCLVETEEWYTLCLGRCKLRFTNIVDYSDICQVQDVTGNLYLVRYINTPDQH